MFLSKRRSTSNGVCSSTALRCVTASSNGTLRVDRRRCFVVGYFTARDDLVCHDSVMSNYRRVWRPGGTYFFTVNALERRGNDVLVRHVDVLREVVRDVRTRHPFIIHGWVVLPEHLHCVIELPPGDADFALRWRLIKAGFSRRLPVTERRSRSRVERRERGVWQRRFWEHLIRDERDFRHHLDYLHFNPVKHGWVTRVADWPHSTFHRYVACGVYPADWAGKILVEA